MHDKEQRATRHEMRERWFPPVMESYEVTPEAAAYAQRDDEGIS